MTTLALPDDWFLYLMVGSIAVGVILWGLKLYKKVMADGKVTLDEVIDTLQAVEDKAQSVSDKVNDAIAENEERKAARKCSICGETGHNKRNCPNKED